MRRKSLSQMNMKSDLSVSDSRRQTGSINPQRLADLRAAANLVKDLRAPLVPLAVARREAAESKRLARAVAAGKITLAEAREQLRGCC